MILLYSLLFILFSLLFAAYIHRRRAMSILARHGIPGPKPNLLFGNMFTHLEKVRSIGNVRTYNEYFAKYGKVMGYYVGKKPTILVNDVELIRRIQIKDFANFADREQPTLKYGLHPNPRFFSHIITATGPQWKMMRTILNPTFSSAKLKTMTATMSSCTDIFLDKVQKKANSGEEFDLYQAFQLLTTDVIAKTALGIDTDVQNNPDDEFFQAAKALFDIRPNALFLAFLWFPELDSVLYPLRRGIEIVKEYLNLSRDQTLSRLVAAAIKLREGEIKKKNDLLQLMLDAKASDEEIRNTSLANLTIDLSKEEKSEKETSFSTTNNSTKKDIKALTADEIVANAIIFYEAGYETTSTALGFIAHFLVNYPEVQEKVREEVLALNGQFDYSSLGKLPYMEQVVCEAMRFYPPVTSFVTRTAREDYHYGSMTIPAGTTVRIPAHQLHHSEEHWASPEIFDPERFSPDRKSAIDPVLYQPFGTGPRNCIGMRFAQMEIRLTLARLLSKFRLVPGPSTEKELTIDYKFITETPKNGVWVKAVPV